MSYDPRHTDDRPGTSPHKGLNVRTFMIVLIIALVLLLSAAIVFIRGSSRAASPEQNQAPHHTGNTSEGGHTNSQ